MRRRSFLRLSRAESNLRSEVVIVRLRWGEFVEAQHFCYYLSPSLELEP